MKAAVTTCTCVVLLFLVLSQNAFSQNTISYTIKSGGAEKGSFVNSDEYFAYSFKYSILVGLRDSVNEQIKVAIMDPSTLTYQVKKTGAYYAGYLYSASDSTQSESITEFLPRANITMIDTLQKKISGTFAFDSTAGPLNMTGSFSFSAPHLKPVVRYGNKVLSDGDTISAFSNTTVGLQVYLRFDKRNYSLEKNNASIPLKFINAPAEILSKIYINSNSPRINRIDSQLVYVGNILEPGVYEFGIIAGTNARTQDYVGDTLKLYLRIPRKTYSVSCNGLNVVTFDASLNTAYTDSSIVGFEQGAFTELRAKGIIWINNFLKFRGELVIDTSNNKITASGEWSVDSVVLPLGAGIGRYVLDSSVNRIIYLGADCKLLYLAFKNSINDYISSGIAGFKFRLDSINFIPDGLRIGLTIGLPITPAKCDIKDTSKTKNSEIVIAPLEIKKTGIGGTVQLKNIALYPPGFCVNSAFLGYYSSNDSLSLGAEFKTPFLDKAGISAGWLQGYWNALAFKVELAKSIPIAQTTLGLKGIRGGASGWSIPPLQVNIGGTLNQVANDKLMELDVDLSYKEPSELKGKATGKLFKVGSSWQGEASVAATLDWQKYMALDGSIKVGTFGADYAFNGNGKLKFTWNPKTTFDGSLSGSFNIPKISTGDSLVDDYINAYLPITLVRTEAILKSSRIRANVNYYGIFKAYLALDLNKSVGEKGFFDFGFGNRPLQRAFDRSKGTPLAATTNQYTIPEGALQAIIRIRSSSSVAASKITTPDGTVISSTVGDSSVVYNDRGTKSFWYLREPKSGKWTVTLTNPQSSDTIDAVVTMGQRPFSISAQQNGNSARVTWDNSESESASMIDFYLDTDSDSTDGFYIGSADESIGNFIFTLDDSLSECSYHIYGIRDNRGGLMVSYASEELTVFKSIPQPEFIRAGVISADSILVKWNHPSNMDGIGGYIVYVLGDSTHDSVYATVSYLEDQALIIVPSAIGKRISMISVRSDGTHSCKTDPTIISATTTKDGRQLRSKDVLSLSVFPNPTTSKIQLEFNLPDDSFVGYEVYDQLGRKIITTSAEYHYSGVQKRIIDISHLAVGTYYIRVISENSTGTVKVMKD